MNTRKYPYFLVAVIALFFIACEESTMLPHPEIQFEELQRSSKAARACATAFVVDQNAYITLGRNGKMLKDMWRYDPATDSWDARSDFPGKERVFPISAVVNGKAYVGLGFNGGVYRDESYLQDFWRYDPIDDSWERMADYPARSTNNAVSFVFQNEIYVTHGFGTKHFNNDVWKYTPATNTWTELANFPGFRRTCAVACSDGNRIFAGTGYAKWNEDDWWEYHPDSDQWTRKKNMPDKGRINGLAFSAGNRFFVAMGRHFAGMNTGGHLKADVMEYNAERNRWINRGELTGGERENAVSFVINDTIYIAFGENLNSILHDVVRFTP